MKGENNFILDQQDNVLDPDFFLARENFVRIAIAKRQ